MDKISVIIPVYNIETYIETCLDSIINQTYSNLEIIIINDGSKDNTHKICDAYKEKDERIVVKHQQNVGVAVSRNNGIKMATGKYICFVDGDDYIKIDMIQLLADAMKHAEMAINSLVRFNEEKKFPKYDIERFFSSNPIELLLDLLKNDKFISCCRCMFKKDIIDKNNLIFTPDRKYGEDLEFTHKYMLNCQQITYVDDAEYFYRKTTQSAMSKATYLKFQDIDAMQSFLEYAESHLPRDKVNILFNATNNNRFIHTIYITIINLLIHKESIFKILSYMKKHDLEKILQNATVDKHKDYYLFWKLWKISPIVCLITYKIKITLGKYKKLIKSLIRKK